MKKKLLLLNVALLALSAAVAWRLRQHWLAARARQETVLRQQIKPAPVPPPPLSKAPEPVSAAAYVEIAQNMVFSRDRNPNVEIEVAPPKPMPPLPAAHGFMNLGEPTILLSERPGAAQKGYRVGDTIGAFKLLALSGSEIVFEWDGQKVVRPLEELLAEGVKQAPAQSPERSTPAPQPAATSTLTTVTPPASVSGPGAPITAEIKACQAGDTSPPGTIVAGLKKVVNETPFGKACRWEPVK